jgi:hypothetical protein
LDRSGLRVRWGQSDQLAAKDPQVRRDRSDQRALKDLQARRGRSDQATSTPIREAS